MMSTIALSELLGAPVYDATGASTGRVREVALAPQEDRTRIALLIVRTPSGNRLLPLSAVSNINGGEPATTAAGGWGAPGGETGCSRAARRGCCFSVGTYSISK